MQLYQQYATLKHALLRENRHGGDEASDIPVTVKEISGWLYCTERNVKHILKRISELEWIVWMPGRGRGNRSRIRFLAVAEELLLQEAQEFARQGNLKAAMEVFRLDGLESWASEKFLAWLGGYFGYQQTEEIGGDKLRLPTKAKIYTLDPVHLYYARDVHYAKMALETLVRYDPAKRSVVPHLAHDWDCDEQGRKWTFYLRKGVKFHHGREMKASDVAYSLRRLQSGQATDTNSWLTDTFASVKALGGRIVEIELSSSNYMLPNLLSASPMSIVPEDIYRNAEANGTDISKFPVGSGPFRVAKHDEGVLVLEAFPDYWGERAHLDSVELMVIPKELENPDGSSGLRFHLGSEDFVKNIRFDYSNWRQMPVMTLGCTMLALNSIKAGPMRDAKLREAIGAALDRRELVKQLGKGIPATGFLPPRAGEPAAPEYEDRRFDDARELVKRSAYRGETLKLMSTEPLRIQAEWLIRRFGEIGLAVEVEYISNNEIPDCDRLLEGDLMLGGVVGDDDEDRCLLEMYKMNNLFVRSYMDDGMRAAADAEIVSLLAEPSNEKRNARIRGLQRLLTDGHCFHFLLHVPQNTVFNPKLQGMSINSLGFVDYKSVWFRSHSAGDSGK
ncbi:ABC transporter substrate-binding protein [Cohnella suwonensis]|uniref:ABC transporter substrate-binding protein n=1 Tax=Cohnella suwonensis TaxID=696072 RepID=A0ABW0LUQ3_9BACL